jgi:DTW domain-containing protein YfiP
MDVGAKIVILMHPKEEKHERTATGRLASLCLKESEIVVGVCFDGHPRVRSLLADPRYLPVLLYPDEKAIDLSVEGLAGEGAAREGPAARRLAGLVPGERRLLVFLLDGTWACAGKMYKQSSILRSLPSIKFTASEPSRWLIKRQPRPGCLSTIEAIHELLLSLERAGLGAYPDRWLLLSLFARMQAYQIESRDDPSRKHHRVPPPA